MLENLSLKLQQWQFSRAQQQAFLEDVSVLVEDGVPANQAVQTIADIATGSPKLVADNILQKIAEGKHIADGMLGWFAQPIVEIIRAGEEGGTLKENLSAAARALLQQSRGFTSLINSTLYPLTVVFMALGVSVFMKHSVLTSFEEIKPLALWPANGKFLYGVATFVQSWWWVIILCVVALVFLLVRLLSELTGDARKFLDSIPIFSLYRDVTAARFMETLGLLISNGIVLKRALAIIRAKASHYLAWHIYMMEFRLSGGRENIAEVIDTGLIQKSDILRLRVIAKGKGFEHALIRLGRLSGDRTQNNIETTGKIIGFILLGSGAAWAAFMIFTIYSVGSFIAT
jgi:type II secretory pathway component PulF